MKRKKVTSFEAERVMEKSLDIGEAMLCCGAEILRVEDTIMRICLTYGDGIVDVFTILSLIIVSWHTTDDRNFTQTRRIYSYSTNLDRLEDLNALSRYICENTPSCDEIDRRIEDILYGEQVTVSKGDVAGHILASSGFAVFFGGTIQDGIAAALVSVFLYFCSYFYGKRTNNRVVYTLICSFLVGILCTLSVYIGIGIHLDKVMIGIIMLLIPGINIMNALRDMICGDIITGLLRLAEALMIAVAIAAGFGLSIVAVQSLAAGMGVEQVILA